MQYKKTVLGNGLRVVTVPMPGSLTTTILVLVKAGAEYETHDQNGISHFLEHMCFKGTSRRPDPVLISKELELMGVNYNAFTDYEQTGYYAKTINANFPKVLEIVSDMYLNPLIDQAELDKERGVIIEERNMIDDDPMSKVNYVLREVMYGDQPAGSDIAGPKSSILSLTRDQIVKYRASRYLAENTIITVAGAMDEEEVIRQVEEAFNKIPTGKSALKVATVTSQDGPQLKVIPRDVDQSHIAMGFRSYSSNDPRRFAAGILAAYLGDGMSSKLFTKVRSELGAAYYIYSDTAPYMDYGELKINAGIGNDKLEISLKAILEECRKVAKEGITASELDEVKSKLISSLGVNLETSSSFAIYYGGQEIKESEVLTPEELVASYLKVTAQDIQDAARDTFRDSKLNLAIIGSGDRENSLRSLLTVE